MTAANVALRQAGLVRVMASYQDGIPLALTRLSYFWKHQVTFAPGGFFNLGFRFTVPSSSTAHSNSDLYLHVVDRRFPWHWAMRVGDDDACLAWGEFYKAELLALDVSEESSVTGAIRYDRPVVVKWLLDQGFSVSSTAMQEAVKRSDVALVEQLCAATSQSIRGVVALTIFHGRLDLLEYLYTAFPTALRTTGLAWAHYQAQPTCSGPPRVATPTFLMPFYRCSILQTR
ncbi:hypothetical protein SPRG_22149 [Saprolegnia parasitica CBS 223.65]|uniref:Uncharacterized protein n=1 Tax=Saprolegnia parasitica (strain CBS 223.65) TaxID=695850 RepID=A0A067CHQ8_SAPPC|nr:hypothetical protein SPRG_22149 [Saprolegnia parasitica CBS 223.65]KDO30259.1 hypothetical protein SPRG_22149 [Saprolegnia parasitica CBS 223.65]|eukprot:XP_012199100.1 hypothetical protein SPRG_22149 [Saprolegnia parasitica CBS 223.65]